MPEVKGVMFHVTSAYDVGCELEEEKFWREMNEEIQEGQRGGAKEQLVVDLLKRMDVFPGKRGRG